MYSPTIQIMHLWILVIVRILLIKKWFGTSCMWLNYLTKLIVMILVIHCLPFRTTIIHEICIDVYIRVKCTSLWIQRRINKTLNYVKNIRLCYNVFQTWRLNWLRTKIEYYHFPTLENPGFLSLNFFLL